MSKFDDQMKRWEAILGDAALETQEEALDDSGPRQGEGRLRRGTEVLQEMEEGQARRPGG